MRKIVFNAQMTLKNVGRKKKNCSSLVSLMLTIKNFSSALLCPHFSPVFQFFVCRREDFSVCDNFKKLLFWFRHSFIAWKMLLNNKMSLFDISLVRVKKLDFLMVFYEWKFSARSILVFFHTFIMKKSH